MNPTDDTVERRDAGAGGRMNRIYRHQRRFYDATRSFLLPGRRALIEALQPPLGSTVLEVGCGTAWMLIQAARRYPEAQLYGLDVSSEMLATARSKVARAGLSTRIALGEADATTFDPVAVFGRATFDRILFSYALSMIPDWMRAVDRAAGAVAAGGSLHIVDFAGFEAAPRLLRRARDGCLARFSVTSRTEMATHLRSLCATRDFDLAIDRCLGGYTQRAVLSHRRSAAHHAAN